VEFVNDGVTDLENNPESTRVRRSRTKEPDMKAPILEPSAAEQSQMKYDSTGMYHWCPSRNINDCLMDRQEAAMTILQVRLQYKVTSNFSESYGTSMH